MKKQNLLLVFALALGLANGQDIHAVEYDSGNDSESTAEINLSLYAVKNDYDSGIDSESTEEEDSGVVTSRKALKDSITAIRGLADNVWRRALNTIPPWRTPGKSIPSPAAIEALAGLYAMDDTLYTSAIDFIDALKKSSTHGEPVEEKIKAIQSSIEEIKSLQVKMRDILYNAVNNELSKKCREGKLHTIKNINQEIENINQEIKNKNFKGLFQGINKLIDNSTDEHRYWIEQSRTMTDKDKKEDARKQSVLSSRKTDEYSNVLKSIAKKFFYEVQPGSTFRKALDNLEDDLADKLLIHGGQVFHNSDRQIRQRYNSL